jgi:hypothetical protein
LVYDWYPILASGPEKWATTPFFHVPMLDLKFSER